MSEEEIAKIRPDNPLESFEGFKNAIGHDWLEPLSEYLEGDKFMNLYSFIKKEYDDGTCFPPPHLIFNAYN